MFSNSSPYHLEALKFMLKFRHYEKTAKYEKNLQSVLKKQLFLLSSVKTSERFFQICVAFLEKLNFILLELNFKVCSVVSISGIYIVVCNSKLT